MNLKSRRRAAPALTVAQQERQTELEEHEKTRLVAASSIRTRQRIDVGKLTTDETRELLDLHRKTQEGTEANVNAYRLDLEELDAKERNRFVELLGKALPDADRERLAKRAEEVNRRRIEQLAEQARAPLPRQRRVWEEPGAVTIPAGFFDGLAAGVFTIADVGAFAFVLQQFESGCVFFSGGRFEGDGDEMTLAWEKGLTDRRMNPHPGEAMGAHVPLDDALRHLHANGWLRVEIGGNRHRVRLGPHALRLWRRPADGGAA